MHVRLRHSRSGRHQPGPARRSRPRRPHHRHRIRQSSLKGHSMLIMLALRNIFRNRRRSAITLAVIIFGAVGLILFGGYKAVTFRGLRESTIRGRLGHLQLFGAGHEQGSQKPLEHALADVASLRARIEKDPRVESTAAQITLMGLISNGDKSETFVATAVEPEKDRAMRGQTVIEGTLLPD